MMSSTKNDEIDSGHAPVHAALIQLGKRSKRSEDLTNGSPSIWFSKRFFVSILLFFGHVMISLESKATHITIVEMVSRNSSSARHTSQVQAPQYDWSSTTVSLILNTFFYGSLTIPLGGILSQKYGGTTTLGVTTLLAGAAMFLTPYSLYVHFYLFLALRTFLGAMTSSIHRLKCFSMAACTSVFASWIPRRERPTIVSSIVNGFNFGNGATFVLCGLIIHSWGWPMAFYSTGILCFIWSLLWLFFVTNDPADDAGISRSELAYIKKETANISATNNNHPYKAILLSAPFWAITWCKFFYGWVNAIVVGYCPLFIKDTMKMDVDTVGYLSSLPNLTNFLLIPVAGLLMSEWIKRSKSSDSQIHKAVLCFGCAACSILFALIAYVDNFVVSMICFVLINGIASYSRGLYELVKVGMAPHHSSLVSGMSLAGQTIGVIVSQYFVGCIVQNNNVSEWYTCFVWSSGVSVFIGLVYFAFGSSEPQPWSTDSSGKNELGKLQRSM